MKKLQSNTFTQFKFPSNLQLKGNHLIYTQTSCDELNNQYNTNLYLYNLSKKTHTCLTTSNTAIFKLFLNENTILYSQSKNSSKQMHFFKLDLISKVSVAYFDLDIKVIDIKHYVDDKFIILANTCFEEENYQVIEKIPFYLNGAGFTYQNDTKLYLFDASNKKLETLIDNKIIHGFELKNDDILVHYQEKSDVLEKFNDFGIYNLSTCTFKKLSTQKLSYMHPCFFKNRILVFASDLKKQGINDNRKIYTCNIDGSNFTLFKDIDLDLGNSVGCDTRFGYNQSIKVIDDTLYFLATVHTRCKLYKLDSHANLSIIHFDGCVEGFAIEKDKLFISGFKNLNLTEIFENNIAITDYSTALKHYYLSNIETITFENDGIEFEGYIIKPIHFDSNKKYPALLQIHGGPKTAYGTMIHHEMQLLANNGYFVFYMNPRGSSGRGVLFSDIRGKYGTMDYADLMKFCDIVIEKYPNIDINRLGVLGGSYGGFMTNWIVTHTNRFKAANTQRCISNWISFYGVSDIGYYFAKDQTQATPWDNLDKLWESSPLKHIKNCKTPLLIIHSDKDYRCPLEQAYQLFTALKLQQTPTKLIVFKDENHDLSRSGSIKNRIHRLDEIIKWFDEYLK